VNVQHQHLNVLQNTPTDNDKAEMHYLTGTKTANWGEEFHYVVQTLGEIKVH